MQHTIYTVGTVQPVRQHCEPHISDVSAETGESDPGVHLPGRSLVRNPVKQHAGLCSTRSTDSHPKPLTCGADSGILQPDFCTAGNQTKSMRYSPDKGGGNLASVRLPAAGTIALPGNTPPALPEPQPPFLQVNHVTPAHPSRNPRTAHLHRILRSTRHCPCHLNGGCSLPDHIRRHWAAVNHTKTSRTPSSKKRKLIRISGHRTTRRAPYHNTPGRGQTPMMGIVWHCPPVRIQQTQLPAETGDTPPVRKLIPAAAPATDHNSTCGRPYQYLYNIPGTPPAVCFFLIPASPGYPLTAHAVSNGIS